MFVRAHQLAGNEVEVASLDGPTDGPAADAYEDRVGCRVHACGPARANYFYSPRLDQWLSANYQRFDGAIVNGIWQYHGVAARRVLAGRKPYVVFAHGMLDPYFKNRYPLKHLKKLVYWVLQEHRNLNNAQAVCFTSEEEKRVAAEGFPLRSFRRVVVPYGTMGPSGDPEALKRVFLAVWPQLQGQKYLLFLGRIHPKKGCDLLLEAFAKVAAPDLQLVMAGPDETGWGSELRRQAAGLGIAERITWTGMLTGDAKWGALYGAEAFVLPSHQENFGIAVAARRGRRWRGFNGTGQPGGYDSATVGISRAYAGTTNSDAETGPGLLQTALCAGQRGTGGLQGARTGVNERPRWVTIAEC